MTDDARVKTNSPPPRKPRSTHRPRPPAVVRPSADPLHWWRTRAADDFDDLDLRVVVLLLNRYALVRHDLWDALSGSASAVISLVARRPSSAGDRDLLITCLLRSALIGAADARLLLIQILRRDGHHALATSWRLARQDLRRLIFNRKKRKVHRQIPSRASTKQRYRRRPEATPPPRSE